MTGTLFRILIACFITLFGQATVSFAVESFDYVPDAYRAALSERLKPADGEAGAKRQAWADALKAQTDETRESFAFLLANMPDDDFEKLSPDFLARNVALAHEARNATPWAAAVPLELFQEQVLPYASVNERRDDWRKDFMDRFLPMVRDLKTADEVVKKLNIEVFKTFGVAYHPTKRPKPDQSPYESIEAKFASCTGLSILLIDACRAVGIPARFVGVPQWTTVKGNHSWVEVFTDQWRFVGACEPSKLDETWFIGNASKADESDPMKRIYASSFRKTGTHFPLIWNRSAQWVQAEDVTRWYTRRRAVSIEPAAQDAGNTLQIRLNGRIVAQVPMDGPAKLDLPHGEPLKWCVKARDGKILRDGEWAVPETGDAAFKG
ncbi:transglutaminase domain-containing protein [bacterium]|nr:transglutaminase domain-containing protein [bacterium]